MAITNSTSVTPSTPAAKPRTLFGHPIGLYPLFFTEMWERFGFYLMLAVLPLYLSDSQKGGFGWTDAMAAVLVGSYNGLVYFTPFIGGLLADRLFGYRRTIVVGAILMMIGYFTLALPGAVALYAGLGIVILGNGAFKPNISTLLGNLYPPDSPNKDAGYNIFYMGINIGAFVCTFVAALVRNYVDAHPISITSGWALNGWHAAFATAALGMLVGLVIFSCSYPMLRAADRRKQVANEEEASLQPLWFECLLPALIVGGLCWWLTYRYHDLWHIPLSPITVAFFAACIPVVMFFINVWRRVQDRAERGRVLALLTIFAVAVVFWTTFYLPTTVITFWARDDVNRQATGLIQSIAKTVPDLTENAEPKYFYNAGPEVPRPDRNTYQVVSPDEYATLEKQHKLAIAEGKPIYVTPEMLKKVYANTNAETPILPPGKDLRLINTEEYQSLNPAYIILLTPVVVGIWMVARRWNAEPSTPAKMGMGLLLAAMGPLLILGAVIVSGNGETKASSWWIVAYFVPITIGELWLSPMGLSLVNKMAPRQISALMMGGWFLATAIGAKMSGILGEQYSNPRIDHHYYWAAIAICDICFGVLLLALVPWLNRQMTARSSAELAVADAASKTFPRKS